MRKYILLVFIFLYTSLFCNISPNEINGKWIYFYNQHYGYEFNFKKGRFADIIVYAKSHFFLFKGIYKITDDSKIDIDVMEMKYTTNKNEIRKNLTKTSSSRLIFDIKKTSEKGKNFLTLKTSQVKIDGNNSEGYFEKSFKLQKK